MKACNLEVDGDAMVEALITSLDAEIRYEYLAEIIWE